MQPVPADDGDSRVVRPTDPRYGALVRGFNLRWVGKPAAVIGAAIGRSGTMRAQLHLRQIFAAINILGLNKPELYVTFAGENFDVA